MRICTCSPEVEASPLELLAEFHSLGRDLRSSFLLIICAWNQFSYAQRSSDWHDYHHPALCSAVMVYSSLNSAESSGGVQSLARLVTHGSKER